MADYKDIARLFGFIGKNTALKTHAMYAGAGIAARTGYNMLTGRDLTSGWTSAGVLGAAGNVGWKTFGAYEKYASPVAKALRTFGKEGVKIADRRAAAGTLNKAIEGMGLSRGFFNKEAYLAARAAKPSTNPVAASVTNLHAGGPTVVSSQPINGTIQGLHASSVSAPVPPPPVNGSARRSRLEKKMAKRAARRA